MMTQEGGLKQIENLGDIAAEFLVAAGVEAINALAMSDAATLRREMEGANAILNIDDVVPSVTEIEGWIGSARAIVDLEEPGGVVRLEADVLEPEIRILDAIPVHPQLLIEQNISVRDVAPMDVFLEEEFESPVEVAPRPNRQSQGAEVHKSVSIREVAPMVLRRTDDGDDGNPAVQPLEKNSVHDIRKTASPELNAGKKLHTRSYIRGVLHPQPMRVRFAAIISVVTLLLLPATFVAGGLMLAKHSVWLATIPAAFLIFGILYFLYARGLKCRVCGQSLFSPKACRRHIKGHRIPFLGYILPTSIHILLFHWFRCMYCGTSVRIKE